jgi:mannose-6-phosphate isomerase-like protein (cupin superfamily)
MPIEVINAIEFAHEQMRRTVVINTKKFHSWVHYYKPGAHDEMHCHNEDQTFIILEGECTMKFPDGGASVLKAGMMATITGGSFYQLNNLTDSPLIMIGNRSGSQNTTLKIDYETRKPLNEGGFRDLEVKDTTLDVAALART